MTLPVVSFECAACGEIHHAQTTATGLPIGWSAHAATVWCASCTAAGIPARELAKRPKRPTRRAA